MTQEELGSRRPLDLHGQNGSWAWYPCPNNVFCQDMTDYFLPRSVFDCLRTKFMGGVCKVYRSEAEALQALHQANAEYELSASRKQ